jgi:hypothetical protein
VRRAALATACAAVVATVAAAQAPPPFVFLGAEDAFARKTVKGAPYAATTETQIVQTLADGNRITHRSTGFAARDSEGRTRREQALAAIGALLAGPGAPKLTVIHDPVARVTYILEPDGKRARRLRWPEGSAGPEAPPMPPFAALGNSRFPPGPGAASPARTEALGAREIDSVTAQGTRSTLVVPAGEIGNEKALAIVSERWYSADLDVVLETRHSDPRFGETRFRVLGLERKEPDRGLFEVPADYRIEDGPVRGAVPTAP